MLREVAVPENIRLGQFLKWTGITETGGQGKLLIQSGAVKVNGSTETRRGRVLKHGDLVSTGNQQLKVVIANGG